MLRAPVYDLHRYIKSVKPVRHAYNIRARVRHGKIRTARTKFIYKKKGYRRLHVVVRRVGGGGTFECGESEPSRALYYIIGGHFGPPKTLSEHKKYEVLLGPPFLRSRRAVRLTQRGGESRGASASSLHR